MTFDAKVALNTLCRLSGFWWRRNDVHPVEEIQSGSGLSAKETQKALKELRQAGLVKSERIKGDLYGFRATEAGAMQIEYTEAEKELFSEMGSALKAVADRIGEEQSKQSEKD